MKKKKLQFSSFFWGGVSDGGFIFQFLKPSLIFARFSTIFGGFLSSIFQFSGGGGSDQNWKIPVFFFFFFEPFPYIFYHLQIIVMSNLQDKLNDLLKGKSESEIQNIIEGLGKSESTEKSVWNEGRPKSPADKKLLVDDKSDDETELPI